MAQTRNKHATQLPNTSRTTYITILTLTSCWSRSWVLEAHNDLAPLWFRFDQLSSSLWRSFELTLLTTICRLNLTLVLAGRASCWPRILRWSRIGLTVDFTFDFMLNSPGFHRAQSEFTILGRLHVDCTSALPFLSSAILRCASTFVWLWCCVSCTSISFSLLFDIFCIIHRNNMFPSTACCIYLGATSCFVVTWVLLWILGPAHTQTSNFCAIVRFS